MWWVGSEYLCTEQHSVHTHPARVGRSPGPGVLLYLTLDLRRRYVERKLRLLFTHTSSRSPLPWTLKPKNLPPLYICRYVHTHTHPKIQKLPHHHVGLRQSQNLKTDTRACCPTLPSRVSECAVCGCRSDLRQLIWYWTIHDHSLVPARGRWESKKIE